MSRTDELEDVIEDLETDAYADANIVVQALLTDIARSLAVIADEIRKQKQFTIRKEECNVDIQQRTGNIINEPDE